MRYHAGVCGQRSPRCRSRNVFKTRLVQEIQSVGKRTHQSQITAIRLLDRNCLSFATSYYGISLLWIRPTQQQIKCTKEAQTTCSATTASTDSGNWNAAKTWKDGKVPVSVDQVVMSSGTNIEVNKASKSDSIEISGYKQTQLFVNANLVIGGDAGTCGTSTCDLDEVSVVYWDDHTWLSLVLPSPQTLFNICRIPIRHLQLKLSGGLEAKVFGGFVRNVKANLFTPGYYSHD